MQRLTLAVVFASLFACTKPGEQEAVEVQAPEREAANATRLTGKLLDHEGKPMHLANVELLMPGLASRPVEVAADGSFELLGPEQGFARLRTTGVDHADFQLPLLLDGQAHELSVRLGTYPRPPSFAGLVGLAHFGDPSQAEPFEFMPGDDGRWHARLARDESDAKATELHYQLANATEVGHTVNGTQADRWIYDGGGDYWSVITLGPGAIELVFDPALLPPASRPSAVEFAAPESEFARVGEAMIAVDEWQRSAWSEAREVGLAHERFVLLRAKLREAVAAESNAAVRRVLWIGWAGILDVGHASDDEREVARGVLEQVGPLDPLWSSDPGAAANLLALVDAAEYRAALLADNPDPRIGFSLLMQTLDAAERSHDPAAVRDAVEAIRAPRYAEFGGPMFAAMYDPDRPSAPGKPVPEFHLRSLDGKTEFSPDSMRGKTYVIDFWATWCGPCIAAMPELHAAYKALNGSDPKAKPKVEILSVSFDDSAKSVREFVGQRWPMPWSHAHVEPAEHAKLREVFGIQGIPTMVLVGPDGIIIASTPTLEPDTLVELAQSS